MSGSPKLPPAPRPLRARQAANEYAAEYIRWLGWTDATASRLDGDEGIDVVAGTPDVKLVARVRMESRPVEARVVRELRGAGVVVDAKHHLMFALAGYQATAVGWADRADVALFEFANDGTTSAVNRLARELVSAAENGRTGVRPKARTSTGAPKESESPPPQRPRPSGRAGDLRRDDLKILSCIEQWEREDRSHLRDPAGVRLDGMYYGELANKARLSTDYVLNALPDIRPFIHLGNMRKDPVDKTTSYYSVLGLKPAGVKALIAWGYEVQSWRL